METITDGKNVIKLKHSSLGIIALIVFLSPVVPVTFMYMPYLLSKVGLYVRFNLSTNILRILADFVTSWLVIAPLIGFIMSIIDLCQPNRLKILPKIIVILSCIIIVTGIVVAYLDITRMLSN